MQFFFLIWRKPNEFKKYPICFLQEIPGNFILAQAEEPKETLNSVSMIEGSRNTRVHTVKAKEFLYSFLA